ncbi:hypothetical protein [Rhodopirellula bahusiensis]|uniref:hypothetical protein n=2 Tax=Rhodopirellula bahusiensis TaxID=2014065 RepID=UPI00326341C1
MNLIATIWYCLIAFGGIASFCLHEFAGVPIVHSLWATIPAFLVAGYVAMRWMDHALDESFRRINTPIQISTVAGLGELRQFPDRWEIKLCPDAPHSAIIERTILIDASCEGPTSEQLELIRQLPKQFASIESNIREELRSYFADMGAPEDYETVDFSSVSAHILSPNDEIDLEVWYSSIPEHGYMGYSVCLRDWKVHEIYGGD